MTQPDTKPMTLDEDVEKRFDEQFCFDQWVPLIDDSNKTVMALHTNRDQTAGVKAFLATEIKAAEQRGAEKERMKAEKPYEGVTLDELAKAIKEAPEPLRKAATEMYFQMQKEKD